jgi:hypothetical protein
LRRLAGESGQLERLLRSGARFATKAIVVDAVAAGGVTANAARRIGPALVFERLWEETGCRDVVEGLAGSRKHDFALERAVFLTVSNRLFFGASDRAADGWREDYRIDGVEGLDLHHFYRAMAWLGEELGDDQQDDATPFEPCCRKDVVEEDPFARRRDLFSTLDLGPQAAARAPDRLILSPPFVPVPCWWTWTMVPSMSAYSKSGSPDRSWNSLAKTPLMAQRRNLLKTEFHLPNVGGRSRHGAPTRAIHSPLNEHPVVRRRAAGIANLAGQMRRETFPLLIAQDQTVQGSLHFGSLESAPPCPKLTRSPQCQQALDSLPRRGAPRAGRCIRRLFDGRQQQISFAAEKPRLAPVDR